jgi:hypothetical protein
MYSLEELRLIKAFLERSSTADVHTASMLVNLFQKTCQLITDEESKSGE